MEVEVLLLRSSIHLFHSSDSSFLIILYNLANSLSMRLFAKFSHVGLAVRNCGKIEQKYRLIFSPRLRCKGRASSTFCCQKNRVPNGSILMVELKTWKQPHGISHKHDLHRIFASNEHNCKLQNIPVSFPGKNIQHTKPPS